MLFTLSDCRTVTMLCIGQATEKGNLVPIFASPHMPEPPIYHDCDT